MNKFSTDSNMYRLDMKNNELLNTVRASLNQIKQPHSPENCSKLIDEILPKIRFKISQIFQDNLRLFETPNGHEQIKDNLYTIFQLIELIQELTNWLINDGVTKILKLGSILTYIPDYNKLFALHWKNCSKNYKEIFKDDLSKILEVLNHLFGSFLLILEKYVEFNGENDEELVIFTKATLSLCEMPKILYEINSKGSFASWKCFNVLLLKNSHILQNRGDFQKSLEYLLEFIVFLMHTVSSENRDKFLGHLTIINNYLIKILKFYEEQFEIYAPSLISFYSEISIFSTEYYEKKSFPENFIDIINKFVLEILDKHLEQLLKTYNSSIFHTYIFKLQENEKRIYFFNKLLEIICRSNLNEWFEFIPDLIEGIFKILPYSYGLQESWLFEQLIINISASILVNFNTSFLNILLKFILVKGNITISILSMEILIVIFNNMNSEDVFNILQSLLNSVEELESGFFTHRPEIVYLKTLLRRTFALLPDPKKMDIIKEFQPQEHIFVWKILGFYNLDECHNNNNNLLLPIIEVAIDCIKNFQENPSEELIVNIAESLELIATKKDFLRLGEEHFIEIINFLNKFWSSSNNDVLNNNLLKYFIEKIQGFTCEAIKSKLLNLEAITPKLQFLCTNSSYGVPIIQLIFKLITINDENAKSSIPILIPVMEIILKSTNLKGIFLAELKLIEKKSLNIILDGLEPSLASIVFEKMQENDDFQQKNGKFNCKCKFQHKCIEWLQTEEAEKEEVAPRKCFKRMKLDEKVQIINKQQKIEMEVQVVENNCSEVIERIKSDVKCLIKLTRTETLTQKNVAHLRIISGQLSSLM